VQVGDVMEASVVGRVSASEHPGFAVGEHVYGGFGVQEFARSDGTGVTKLDPLLAPLTAYLAALGIPGLTAYFGLDVGRPQPGDTVVVSGAAGGVGSVAGQLARIRGFRVIGIAGGSEKCRWIVDELGFDAAIDYRGDDVKGALRAATPDRVDVYFDNVGGDILDLALTRLNLKARVVICGAISQYNNESRVQGPSNYLSLLVSRARMEGFVVFDYARRYGEAAAEIAGWIGEGRIRTKEHVVTGGIDDFPETLQMLFRGDNVGKLVLQVG
jgi:NADPH-dependent curcumin reductase CurA